MNLSEPLRIRPDIPKEYGVPESADAMPEGATFALLPEKILAWNEFPTTPTGFVFG